MGKLSSYILHIQMISLPALQAAMYAASVIGSATIGLALRHLGNDTSTNLHNVGTSGATSILATSMVGI
jgi:hypothetical protein